MGALRMRLASRAGLLALVALGGLGLTVEMALIGPMVGRADDELVERAGGLAALAAVSGETDFRRVASAFLDGEQGAWAAVRTPEGVLVASAGRPLPPGGLAIATGGVRSLRSSGSSLDYRVLAIPVARSEEAPREIVVGVPVDSIRSVQSVLRSVLLTSILAGVLLVSAGAWFSATLVLHPMSRMTSAARRLAVERSGDLLPQGGTRDEFHDLATLLNELLAKARLRLDEERRFSSDVAHELRNPLALVQARAEVALGEADSDRMRESMAQVLDECHRASRLVATLLDLSRMEKGPAAVPPLDVAGALANFAETLVPLAEQATITLEIASPPPTEALVRVPREVFETCVGVLVDNALRAAGTGGRIEIVPSTDGERVIVDVVDSGPGVRPQEAERIFERFFRGDTSSGLGFGLGLPLARRLARTYGGDVLLVNPGSPGARFRFELPASSS